MHYVLFCKNETCGKVAFKLRPSLKPDDLMNQDLTMAHFAGQHPLGAIQCPHCGYAFQASDFRVSELRPLG